MQATRHRRLKDEPSLGARSAPLTSAVSRLRRGFRRRGGVARSRRLLQVADERVLERSGPARRDEARGRIGRQHATRIHQRNPVAAFGFIHKMGRDEDRHALIARKLDEQSSEPVTRQRIDARGRLVEDQHLGFVNDRNGEREPLADAERQVLGALVGMVAKTEAPD